jgi:hypothetical protein
MLDNMAKRRQHADQDELVLQLLAASGRIAPKS